LSALTAQTGCIRRRSYYAKLCGKISWPLQIGMALAFVFLAPVAVSAGAWVIRFKQIGRLFALESSLSSV
jgi:hypothetical protein